MTTPGVFRTQEMAFRERGNGIRSLPLAGPENSDRLLTGFTDIPPGQGIPSHYHDVEEFVLVLKGQATFFIGESEEHVTAMDATLVAAGTEHRFVNTGTETLRILWVYGGQQATRTLVDTGVTYGHLDPYPQTADPGQP